MYACSELFNTLYDPAASNTSVPQAGNFSILYGDGSNVTGPIFTDVGKLDLACARDRGSVDPMSVVGRCSLICFVVTIAGIQATNQFFSAVTTESTEFQDDPTDGILGLAFQDISNLRQVRHIHIHTSKHFRC